MNKPEVCSHPFARGCERLGISVVKGYELVKRGELQTFLIGRRRYVAEAELQEFIHRQVKKSLAETPTERARKVTAAVSGRARQRDEQHQQAA